MLDVVAKPLAGDADSDSDGDRFADHQMTEAIPFAPGSHARLLPVTGIARSQAIPREEIDRVRPVIRVSRGVGKRIRGSIAPAVRVGPVPAPAVPPRSMVVSVRGTSMVPEPPSIGPDMAVHPSMEGRAAVVRSTSPPAARTGRETLRDPRGQKSADHQHRSQDRGPDRRTCEHRAALSLAKSE